MDSVYIREGALIDIVDKEWINDKMPNADVNVPLDELPDNELNELNNHTAMTVKEFEMKWNESGLHQTWVIINSQKIKSNQITKENKLINFGNYFISINKLILNIYI